MATTKKTATKGSKTTSATASKKQVVNSAIANKVSKLEQPMAVEDKAKALTNLDRTISKIANEVMAQTLNEVQGLQNWLKTFKRFAIAADPEIAKLFNDDQRWFSFVVKTKMYLNHVIVLTEGKDKATGEKTLIRSIKPVMFVKKTDKISLPDYFGKAKVESYRYDKVNNGEEVTISDSKELEVTRSVKTPKMVLVTDAEGNQFMAPKVGVNSGGVAKRVYEEKDEVFVPLTQLDFDFKEVKEAIKKAMLATFGSKAYEAK